MPEEAYYDYREGEICHIAFVEENEIAYVGTREQSSFKGFITGVVLAIFEKYEELFFECDDCDKAAMMLKELFEIEVEESYDTYVREERLSICR